MEVQITYLGRTALVPNVVVDTGSARTVIASDALAALGIAPSPDDTLYAVLGVGGTEVVFACSVGWIHVGDRGARDFEIEVGAMDYGFQVNGRLGPNLLRQTGALLDLGCLELAYGKHVPAVLRQVRVEVGQP